MSQIEKDQQVSRRGFLKAAALTAAAATATGSGAAWLQSNTQSTAPLPVAPLPPPQTIMAAGTNTGADLFAQLVAAQAENVRLQAKLDAVERRLESEQSDNDELQVLRSELDTATQQVGILSGLVTLYEQMEAVDLDAMLDQGLASLSASINELLGEVPSLAEGIEMGHQALDDLEEHIPILEESRRWLDEHSAKLQTLFSSLETVLEGVVEAAGPFLQMLNEWFQGISKWLPFGLGRSASNVMQSITGVLTETPNTIAGLDVNVTQPLNVWLGEERQEVPLRQDVVKPLRADVLERVSQTMDQVQRIESIYQGQLSEPAQSAIENRRAVRDLIGEYRQRHQI